MPYCIVWPRTVLRCLYIMLYLMMSLLLLTLQDDETDAVTPAKRQRLSTAVKNQQNESISNGTCHDGMVMYC